MPKTFREMVNAAKSQIQEITAEELERRRAAGEPILVVDVREKDDYSEGHIAGAVSVPRGVLEMKIDDHTMDEERPIVLYCGGGSRSALSALTLQQMGYRNVLSLEGGFRGWEEAARETETD
jgi:sulfur-carrier protein adenylyltransferase/sulfurtransferase